MVYGWGARGESGVESGWRQRLSSSRLSSRSSRLSSSSSSSGLSSRSSRLSSSSSSSGLSQWKRAMSEGETPIESSRSVGRRGGGAGGAPRPGTRSCDGTGARSVAAEDAGQKLVVLV